jgi:hypothetical protein
MTPVAKYDIFLKFGGHIFADNVNKKLSSLKQSSNCNLVIENVLMPSCSAWPLAWPKLKTKIGLHAHPDMEIVVDPRSQEIFGRFTDCCPFYSH